MKKILPFLLPIFLLTACSDENSTETDLQEISTKSIQMYEIPSQEILNQTFSFNKEDDSSTFANSNKYINAINEAILCTLSPHNPQCPQLNIPKFILMEDESLQRPTQIQYKITKIKPLAGGILHIYTQSRCNNNWFGLCQGNIIYVLQNQNNQWYVSDIFALATTNEQ